MSNRVLDLRNSEVFLFTSRHGAQESGAIVTWITPCTLATGHDRIMSALSRSNLTTELLLKSGTFIVQLLAEDQWPLMATFGLTSGRDSNKFEGLPITRSKSGLPVVSGTCGWMECKVGELLDLGDRVICVADVVSVHREGHSLPLCKSEAIQKFSPEIQKRFKEKFAADAARDANLIRLLSAKAPAS